MKVLTIIDLWGNNNPLKRRKYTVPQTKRHYDLGEERSLSVRERCNIFHLNKDHPGEFLQAFVHLLCAGKLSAIGQFHKIRRYGMGEEWLGWPKGPQLKSRS